MMSKNKEQEREAMWEKVSPICNTIGKAFHLTDGIFELSADTSDRGSLGYMDLHKLPKYDSFFTATPSPLPQLAAALPVSSEIKNFQEPRTRLRFHPLLLRSPLTSTLLAVNRQKQL
ncbi:hypothetical protein HPP92_005104 [Vanilla planifolia]|uniref:Uncharacterized protein n=1 Tax=Vanilla planifolia TaxID=51239 RepID=A0A835VEK4_VANPL|nr:hypothetical protein HPP92_005104 [Vanilla planifolia]